MNIDEVIFTSYCFGEQYTGQQVRLAQSIRKIYPQANLHFLNETEEIGKPKFQQSLYGFKVQMIFDCLKKGFKKVVYFDTAVCLEREIDEWFELTNQYGFLALRDKSKLATVISNNCLSAMEIDREALVNTELVGGSIYVIDFNTVKGQHLFGGWAAMERMGLFGTQDDLSHDRLQSHRMDEACLALVFHLNGMKPLAHNLMHYAYEHPDTKGLNHEYPKGEEINPIVIKRHFH